MKAQKFLLQTVVNPNTSEESQRIAIAFDNGKVLRFYQGQQTIEAFKESVKEPSVREDVLKSIVVRDDQFGGQYCVVSMAKTVEEF